MSVGMRRCRIDLFDCPGLDDSSAGAALHDTCRGVRELRELCCGEHAGWTGTDDEYVYFVGELCGPVNTDAGGGLHPRVSGYITVVVELHGLSSLHCGLPRSGGMPGLTESVMHFIVIRIRFRT